MRPHYLAMSSPYSLTSSDEEEPKSTVPYPQLTITTAGQEALALAPRELAEDAIEDTQSDLALAELEKENRATKASTDPASKKCWPQYKTLMRSHPSVVKKLLLAVDDTDAQHEYQAKNTPNIKGNKWANLRFVCFGGDRGSLVGVLPMVNKATELKKKVKDIWEYCDDNKEGTTIDAVLLRTALRQYGEYQETEKEIEKGKDNNRNVIEQRTNDMVDYERQQGAELKRQLEVVCITRPTCELAILLALDTLMPQSPIQRLHREERGASHLTLAHLLYSRCKAIG